MTRNAVKHMAGQREPGAVEIDRLTAPTEAGAQLAIEQQIFDGLPRCAQRLRLWQPLAALIVTGAEANRPGFVLAAAAAEDRGLPVHLRRSGGGAVCLGPGSLVVSHFYTAPRNDIDASYRQFAGLLREAVATLELSLTEEHVVGAYCDGRFDLAWNGRKVGGIAQRRRMNQGRAWVWIHAVLAVDAEALRYPEAVAQFYADLGSLRVADPRNTTTLAHCLAGDLDSHDLITRVGDAIVRAFALRATADASG